MNLTQRELARLAEIAPQTVADFERGARQPHPNNIKAMRQVFETGGLRFRETGGAIVGMDFARREAPP